MIRAEGMPRLSITAMREASGRRVRIWPSRVAGGRSDRVGAESTTSSGPAAARTMAALASGQTSTCQSGPMSETSSIRSVGKAASSPTNRMRTNTS